MRVSVVAAIGLSLALLGCAGGASLVYEAAARDDVALASRSYNAYVDRRGYADPEALSAVAFAVLRDAARSDDARLRDAAFAALASLGQRARPALDALSSRDGVTGDRATALRYALDGRGRRPPPRLREALRSDDPERRAAGLASIRGRSSLARLTELSHDSHIAVRLAALGTLSSLGADAVEPLRASLDDSDPRIARGATAALFAAAPSVAIEALSPRLAGETTERSVDLARQLMAHGDPRGEAHLADALARAPDAVRVIAAAALSRRPSRREAALTALRSLSARADESTAARANAALAITGDDAALSRLREAMWSRDASVRRLAVSLWPRAAVSAGASAVDPLAVMLTDRDRALAVSAAAGVIAIATR